MKRLSVSEAMDRHEVPARGKRARPGKPKPLQSSGNRKAQGVSGDPILNGVGGAMGNTWKSRQRAMRAANHGGSSRQVTKYEN